MKTLRFLILFCLTATVYQAQAADPTSSPPPPPPSLYTSNPGVDLWNQVRQRDADIRGTTQVKGKDAGVLINTGGQNWREFRMQELIPRAGAAILIVLVIIGVFRLLRWINRNKVIIIYLHGVADPVGDHALFTILAYGGIMLIISGGQ